MRFKPSEADLVSAYEFGYQFGCIVQDKEPVKPKKPGARSLVKCLVCGEIFDSSLEICPVCGVGKENFVPVDAQETGYINNTQEYYVILGNGAAGFNAAKAIRERDKTGSIVMISNEPYPSYNRPMLTKSIVAGLSAEQIAIEGPAWYEENRVYQMLGKQVTAVDQEQKEVLLDSGEKIRYTRLIYALGSECFIPPMEGRGLPEVIAIRRLSDVEKVETLMEKAENAVVIGGGVLGLEAAWELKKAGLKVTVLEVAPVLMGRQLDAGSAEILKEIAAKHDVAIRTGVTVAAIEGEGHVSGVRIDGGETIPADIVIVSAGVRAKTDLAQEMGLEIGRAVKVDSHMATNLPDIYACGDCAEYEGMNYAIWPEASEQGRIAGANAAGEPLEYEPVEAALTFHGMNTALFAAGDNGKNPNLLYKTVEFRDMGKEQYRKYFFLNNRLSGVILIGDLGRMPELGEALKKHASYKDVIG